MCSTYNTKQRRAQRRGETFIVHRAISHDIISSSTSPCRRTKYSLLFIGINTYIHTLKEYIVVLGVYYLQIQMYIASLMAKIYAIITIILRHFFFNFFQVKMS